MKVSRNIRERWCSKAILITFASTLASDSVTISWATDENSDSLVKYGTSAGTYDFSKSIATMVTSHTVTLTGLGFDTLYYFVVNSTDRSGNSNESNKTCN